MSRPRPTPDPVLSLRHRGASLRLPILHEDRDVLAVDKPPGWMLAPADWKSTRRNLWAALEEGVSAGAWWARSRGLRLLRPVHRLDTETSGILLLAKHEPAVRHFSRLFATGGMAKTYLAVVTERPHREEWTCRAPLADRLDRAGRIQIDARHGRPAETVFRVLGRTAGRSLLEARPLTGRTHQIRVHLAEAGCPILGDAVYGGAPSPARDWPLALRAVALEWAEGRVAAPAEAFLRGFGVEAAAGE